MRWLEKIFAGNVIDDLRGAVELKQLLIDDLTRANKRLRDEVASLQRRDTVQRALIASLRDCNRELDQRNCEVEGR